MADREQGSGKLGLAQLVQEVGLVLAGICAAHQLEVAILLAHLGVMTGCDFIRTQRLGFIEEGLEFDFAVAQHIRIWGASGFVFRQEMGEDFRPVGFGEIARIKRDTELAADGKGILAVFFGAALAVVLFIPVLHEQAAERMTLLLEQQRGHRRIHAARHAQHDVHAGLTDFVTGQADAENR